jgi:predicted DCC family thiol-disulfide oxidoreductase YuxK
MHYPDRMSHLVLYDGVCGLCNRTVQAILKRDQAGKFLFAPLEGDLAESLLLRRGHEIDALDSMILFVDYREPAQQVLSSSEAALFIAREAGGWWRIFSLFGVLPKSVLNSLYNLVARNRYRWFGRYESCPLPEKRYQERFLDRSE